MTSPPDKDEVKKIIDLARAGDQAAFGSLYETYYSPIFRYVSFRIKSQDDVEDIVQVIFMKVLKSLPKMALTHETPLPFFYTVARNTVIDHWRKKKSVRVEDPEQLFDDVPDTNDGPEDTALRKEAASTVREALKYLSPDQQEVLTLRFINELSNREISKIMKKTEVAIRQLQSRALKALRIHIKEQ